MTSGGIGDAGGDFRLGEAGIVESEVRSTDFPERNILAREILDHVFERTLAGDDTSRRTRRLLEAYGRAATQDAVLTQDVRGRGRAHASVIASRLGGHPTLRAERGG